MNWNSLRLRQLDKVVELPIGSQHEQALERTSTSAQGFAHGMQPVNQFRLTIASSGWYRRACPR